MSSYRAVQLLNPIAINTNISPKGEYDNGTTYGVADSVSYLGSSYVCIAATTGNLPTDITYWQLLAQKGDTGSASIATQVRNQSGSIITKMSVVYISGSTGLKPLISLAQANSEATSSKTYGLVKAGIANNADGEVAEGGLIDSLDTSSFTAGDLLWLSPSVAGGLTSTRPTQPNHAVFIGYVTRSHPALGTIIISVANGYELEELHNVLITSPKDGDLLTYESASSLWKNKEDKSLINALIFG